jgi:GNAT superfamily N-acetyltransferase
MIHQFSASTPAGPADRLVIRRVGFDDWANVRYVHAAAFRLLAGNHFTPAECDAFEHFVRSQDYVDLMLGESIWGAWLDDQLVGTSGWIPADDSGALARITSVFVRPFFTRMGIGRRLVLDAEARARNAGFERFSARVTFNAVGFFEKLGYDITSYGVQPIAAEKSLPVTYMRKQPALSTARSPAESADVGLSAGPAEPAPLPPVFGNVLTQRGR